MEPFSVKSPTKHFEFCVTVVLLLLECFDPAQFIPETKSSY